MWPELLVPREGCVAFEKFIGGSSVDGERFYSYTRPTGASMLLLVAIGGGGGGGTGFTDISGNDRGGGGGGSSGNLSRLMIPWKCLPQTIFISTGNPAASATDGIASRVLVAPDTSLATANHILKATGGNKGANGTAVGGGAAGAAPTINAATDGPWQGLGTWVALAGGAGGAGGAHTGAAGTAVIFANSGHFITGGAGGGGTTGSDFAGGNVSGTASITPTLSGGTANAAGVKAPGARAQWQTSSAWPGWAFMGGTGGGTDDDAVGGEGGDGSIGCGGGGGGAGATGGAGGKGGQGVVVLVSF